MPVLDDIDDARRCLICSVRSVCCEILRFQFVSFVLPFLSFSHQQIYDQHNNNNNNKNTIQPQPLRPTKNIPPKPSTIESNHQHAHARQFARGRVCACCDTRTCPIPNCARPSVSLCVVDRLATRAHPKCSPFYNRMCVLSFFFF